MIERFEQFCTAISQIQRSISRIERVEMEKYGLKGPHAQCLVAMLRYPEGVTAARLCEICEKDKAAISRTLAELEQAEMIVRTNPEGKRYRASLTLTEKGRQIADNVNSLVYLAVSKASAGYGREKQQVFVQVLNLIAENLQSICRDGLQPNED